MDPRIIFKNNLRSYLPDLNYIKRRNKIAYNLAAAETIDRLNNELTFDNA